MLQAFMAQYGSVYQVNAHPDIANYHLFERVGFEAYSHRDAIPVTMVNRDSLA